MMNTPICDFVRTYARENPLRLHMPGHKGVGPMGFEQLDITEVEGADSLYEARGIIRQSEENASRLFGCPTWYSTEGASHCIRAMVYLAQLWAKRRGKKNLIAAAGNVHKTFLSAAALLDVQVQWLYPKDQESYLSCRLCPKDLEEVFSRTEKPAALYVTCPDYLGGMCDIAALAAVCHKNDCLLLVDNAHGAYLRFLNPSCHPMDLGADLCCDSAHKTLPVLTGGAYLHIGDHLNELHPYAKNALSLFGSTSPSYLILQSLDAANPCLENWGEHLAAFCRQVALLKEGLQKQGYRLYGSEPLKLTLETKSRGYTGDAFARLLREKGVECEFSDPDYVVLMLTPSLEPTALEGLKNVLLGIPAAAPLEEKPPVFAACERVCSIRQAMLQQGVTVPVAKSLGRVLAAPSVGCPPAVPILVCGQRINEAALAAFRYYGIKSVVVTEE